MILCNFQNHHTPKVVHPTDDTSCFHIYLSPYFTNYAVSICKLTEIIPKTLTFLKPHNILFMKLRLFPPKVAYAHWGLGMERNFVLAHIWLMLTAIVAWAPLTIYEPILFDKLCIAMQNLSKGVNVVSEGAPSLILRVLLISLGSTILPRSSIRRTIPVAFIYKSPLISNRDTIICD